LKEQSSSSTSFVHFTRNQQIIYSVFDSVVAVAFQIAFRVKIHANDIFLFFKNHF
jgi:hypothetical protein